MSAHQPSILLVEDDAGLAGLIQDELEAESWTLCCAGTLEAAYRWLEQYQPALVISDLRLPDGNGIELVRHLTANHSEADRPGIIVITAFGSVPQAVACLQAGADDFLTKPLDLEHFMISIRKVMETCRLKDELSRFRRLSGDKGFHGIFGKSAVMRKLFEQVRVVGRASGQVLITGESGTGKELVAKALHEESDRAQAPFLAVNCAGIPTELLESEFFGHAAGAFTGAEKARKGLLQEADGGTLLLDEIGEMPLPLQAKLLRALQDGSVRPVGQDTEDTVDVRIIAATHQDLKRKVMDGAFREDLYYRLETFSVQLPPLRSRGEDLELLAHRFLDELAVAQGKRIDGFSVDAMALLKTYSFPGNVRELRNVIERAVAFCRKEKIEVGHLPERLAQETGADASAPRDSRDEKRLLGGSKLPTMEELQKRYARLVLDEVGGNKRRAAALLGIGRRTLYRWLEEEA